MPTRLFKSVFSIGILITSFSWSLQPAQAQNIGVGIQHSAFDTSIGQDSNSALDTTIGQGTHNALFPSPTKAGGSICSFLVTLLNLITEIGAIIGVLALIAVGFYFIYAQGKKEELQTAKRAFWWTILGVTLLLGSSIIGHILITTVNAVLTAGGGSFANQSSITCSP